MSDLESNLPPNPDPRPAAGSGVTPISSQAADQRTVAETYVSKPNPIGSEGGNPFAQLSSPPPFPSFPSDTPARSSSQSQSFFNEDTYQEFKSKVSRSLEDLAQEGNLPQALFTQAPQQPDFRFGVQLSTPVQSDVKHVEHGRLVSGSTQADQPQPSAPSRLALSHVEHGQTVSGDTPKPQPMETLGQFQFRQDVERETSKSFSQYLGTSSATPMSKEDTIKELANKINHDSGNKLSIAESRAEASKQYENEQSRVASNMADSAPKGTTIYGTEPGEVAKNLASTQRMQGETGQQYSDRRQRMDTINAIGDPVQRKEAMGKYVSEQLGDNYIPLLIRRADGQQGTLIHVVSGVNLRNNSTTFVVGSNGVGKLPSSYYSTMPSFFGFKPDEEQNYTAWFGKSRDGLIQTTNIYKFAVNGEEEETQISFDVTTSNPKLEVIEQEGKKVTIDVPRTPSGTLKDATWREIDVCVDGAIKKMQVLGTTPYDPL